MCDVDWFLMCLFENVANDGVVCDKLEWNSKKGGAEILIPVIRSAGGKERKLACERCFL